MFVPPTVCVVMKAFVSPGFTLERRLCKEKEKPSTSVRQTQRARYLLIVRRRCGYVRACVSVAEINIKTDRTQLTCSLLFWLLAELL